MGVTWFDKTILSDGWGERTKHASHTTRRIVGKTLAEKGGTSEETKRAGFKQQPMCEKCSFETTVVVYTRRDSSLHSF